MNEKTLFAIIALLLVLILGVAAYAAFNNPETVASLPGTAVSTAASAVVSAGNAISVGTGATQ